MYEEGYSFLSHISVVILLFKQSNLSGFQIATALCSMCNVEFHPVLLSRRGL
jgi:hypothetical protein